MLKATRFVGTPARYGYHVVEKAEDLGVTDAAAKLRRYPAAKKQRILEGLQRIGRSKLDSLKGQHDELVEFLARTGDDGARLIADGGGAVFRKAHQLDIPINNQRFASALAKANSNGIAISRLNNFVDDLGKLKDVKGVDRIAQRVINSGGEIGNFRGMALEARVAVREGADSIEELGKDITTSSGRSTDIDILKKDGTIIEVKRGGSLTDAVKGSSVYDDLENQLTTLVEYKAEQGLKGSIEATFKFEPSDDVKSLLRSKNVKFKVIE